MNSNTLPRHPRTGQTAIGWRKPRPGEDGAQPIWPIRGGAEDDVDDGDGTDAADGEAEAGSGDGEPDPEGADQLGDAGKRALDAMKARMHAERDRRKAAEAALVTAQQENAAGKTDGEQPDAAAIRAAALAEARAETLRERAMNRLEAKAARLFADPEDARAYLGAAVEDFLDGDRVDDDAIAEALADLLNRKPYLAATPAKPRFEGTGDGGARKGPDGVKQLGKADLKKMTAEEIVAAQAKGQFDRYLATE